ncbi:MAG: diacylglycerol/polyprenol kinase family protein [Candidatus Helarchaeota archaeon]
MSELINELLYNVFIFLIAFGYVFIVVGVGIFLQKKMERSSEFTRKTIHVFAGFVVFFVFLFTPTFSWFAIIIAGTFVGLLYLASPSGPEFMKAMFSSMAREDDIEEGKIYGPLYYAISITILTSIFVWGPLFYYYWIPVTSLSMMYLGDGIAPFIGKKFGKRTYGPNNRTTEGSIAVFLFGILGATITIMLATFAKTQIVVFNLWIPIIILITAGVFTIIEGITPAGWDNITCPLISTAIITIFIFLVI